MIIHPPQPPPPAPECQYTHSWLSFTCDFKWLFFELAFVHSAPMINSVIELLCTRMVFLRRDAKYAFLAGIIYMFCNYWGSKYVIDRAVYDIPLLNWKKGEEWKSWLGYGAQGPVLAVIVWGIAVITQKRRGFKNGHWIKKGVKADDEDKYDGETNPLVLNDSKTQNNNNSMM